jgi:hypothetical protein
MARGKIHAHLTCYEVVCIIEQMFASVRQAQVNAQGAFFAGIAPGLEGTALALLDPAHDAPLAVYLVASGRSNRAGLARYAGFTRMIAGAVRRLERHGTPALLAIRGYSLSGRPRVHCELIELGALLRWQLLRRRWAVTEIPPGTLHKFASGGGDPSPAAVAAALAGLYRRSFNSAREAEAYGLAHIARALVYPEDYHPERVEALAQIARVRALQSRFEQEARKSGKWRAE